MVTASRELISHSRCGKISYNTMCAEIMHRCLYLHNTRARNTIQYSCITLVHYMSEVLVQKRKHSNHGPVLVRPLSSKEHTPVGCTPHGEKCDEHLICVFACEIARLLYLPWSLCSPSQLPSSALFLHLCIIDVVCALPSFCCGYTIERRYSHVPLKGSVQYCSWEVALAHHSSRYSYKWRLSDERETLQYIARMNTLMRGQVVGFVRLVSGFSTVPLFGF